MKIVGFVFVFVIGMKYLVNYQSIFGQTLAIVINILYSSQIFEKQIRENNRFVYLGRISKEFQWKVSLDSILNNIDIY